MKVLSLQAGRKRKRGGFSLVEATFSIGVISCSFLTLIPLLSEGMKLAGLSRIDRVTGQIAQSLIEQTKLGVPPVGVVYFDDEGASCDSAHAVYAAQSSTPSVPQTLAPSLSQVTLRITPVGAPDHARVYAVVLPAQP